MPAPQTLLDMAGAPSRPQRLAEAAVVMIDAQLEYVTGRLPLTGVGAALEVGAELLAAARAAGRPVIHVQHRGQGDGLFGPDSAFFAIAPQAAPDTGEPVIEKVVPNAFADGALDAKLKDLGVAKIIIAGFMTHLCVSTTARAALDLGYGCSVLAPACATRDLPDGQGGVVAAADIHRVELVALSDRFATIATEVGQLTD
ncbi:MAG: isochorismatase family protein [Alphaproteobacteria bacterium]